MLEAGSPAFIATFFIAALIVAVAAAGLTSLAYVNRSRLRTLIEQSATPTRAVVRALDEPGGTPGAIVALQTVGVAAAALSALLLAAERWSSSPLAALALFAAAMAALFLVQTLARALALSRPETAAGLVRRPLRLLTYALAPVTLPTMSLERWLLALLGSKENGEGHEAELRHLVEAVEENGGLAADEREMIQGIVEMGVRPVREIMVPRIDVVALPRASTVGEVVDVVMATGHSRIPLYDESMDNVVGVVYAKDLLRHLRSGNPGDPAEPLARPPYFVPETKKVDELLREMQRRQTHFAIVVDEYGGTAGAVTIEDLLEEIVGEIRDEYDLEEEEVFERVSDDEAIFDARVSIRDVNELLSLHLSDEFDTLGGLVYGQLGKVPAPGDQTRVDGCTISVLSTNGRRIKKVRLKVEDRPRAPE